MPELIYKKPDTINERVRNQNQRRVAILDDVPDFVIGQMRAGGCVVEAGPVGSETDLEEFAAVLHQDDDVIAALEPKLPEQMSGLIGAALELRKGHVSPLVLILKATSSGRSMA